MGNAARTAVAVVVGIPSFDVSRTAIDVFGWCMFFVVVGAIFGSAGWLCRAWCRGKLSADALYAENERTSALDRASTGFFGTGKNLLLIGYSGEDRVSVRTLSLLRRAPPPPEEAGGGERLSVGGETPRKKSARQQSALLGAHVSEQI